MRRSSIFVAGEELLLKTWIISCCGRGDLGASRTQAAQVSVTHGEWVSRCCPKVFTSTRTLGKCCCLMPEMGGGALSETQAAGWVWGLSPIDVGNLAVRVAMAAWGWSDWENKWSVCVCAHGAGMAKGVLIEWAQGGFPKQWEDCVCVYVCICQEEELSWVFVYIMRIHGLHNTTALQMLLLL